MEPTLEQKQAAIDAMIAAYVERFGEQPDNVTGMVINSNAERVAVGDKFSWIAVGAWRQLAFGMEKN